MKKSLLLFPLYILFTLITSAQSNYKPGYVVTTKGDTLKGYINYKDWDKNPRSIAFKNSPDGQKTEYTSKTLSTFIISGYENYRSFNLWISEDNIDHERLTPWLDTTKKLDTFFLRTITTGKYLTLYSYKDKLKQRYFISDKGSQPVELSYHMYVDTVYSVVVHEANTYRIQLQKFVSEYKPGDVDLINEIQTALYNGGDILKIVFKINGSVAAQNADLTRNAPSFFAGVSVNSYSNSFKVGSDASATTNSSSTTYPGFNIGVDIYTNKNVGRWIFRLELAALPNTVNISYQTSQGTVGSTDYNLKFKQLTLAFTPQLVYNVYNGHNIRFYLDAGLGIGDNIYSSKQYTSTIHFTTSGESSTAEIPVPNLQFLSFNVPVKAGIVINKKIDIYAGFNPKTRFDDDSDYQVNEVSFMAGVNYLFGR